MSHVAVITTSPKAQSDSARRPKRRHAIGVRFRLGYVTLSVVTIALAAVLSLLYFMQVNQYTLAGYKIMDIEEEISSLKEENKRLRYDISQRKALHVIDQKARERLQMVAADEVQYWWTQTDGQEVALR